MNVHDSERLAGLLESSGYVRAAEGAGNDVDLVVFNTCAVRENADNKLYGNLGHILPAKKRRAGMQIAVGGCLAQKDRGTIQERAPWVDVVFGTHNLASLPVLLERSRHNRRGPGRDRRGAAELPVGPALAPGVAVLGVGVDLGRLRQHLHLLHRAQPARPRGRPSPGRCPGRGRGPGRRGRGRGHPARAERELLRPLLRRPGRVRGAAAGVRTDRRAGTGPLHQPAPARLHRRRHRGDGRDARGVPAAAHADAVGFGRCAAGHAPQLPARALPGHHRRGARPDARRGHHHRHHHRVPGRDRGRFRPDPRPGGPGPLRQRVHLPVLTPPGYPGGHVGRPGPEGGRAGALRTPGRRSGRDQLERQPGPGRYARSRSSSTPPTAARTAPPAGCPAARATVAWCTSRCRRTRTAGRDRTLRSPATRSPPPSPTPRRITWSPTRPIRAPSALARPAAADERRRPAGRSR